MRGPAHERISERGYAMAVLLMSISVMAVMMTVAMPVWKTAAQREKEEELIFRGKQYARAIELYGRKLPGALPASVDILVDQKFLRKKYKDPINGQDFDLLAPNSPAAQQQPQPSTGRGTTTSPTTQAGRGATGAQPSRFSTPGGTTGLQAGIIGVVSKSKDTSIRLYNGRSHYNEWVFQYIPRQQAPGAAPGQPGQRGGQGQPGPGGLPGRGGRGDGGRGGRGDGGRGGPGPNFPGGRGGFPFPPMPQQPAPRPPGN